MIQFDDHMGVSENRDTPKSSILIGFSIVNHPFWGIPIFGNTHIFQMGRNHQLVFNIRATFFLVCDVCQVVDVRRLKNPKLAANKKKGLKMEISVFSMEEVFGGFERRGAGKRKGRFYWCFKCFLLGANWILAGFFWEGSS